MSAPFRIAEPGGYYGLPADDYHADPCPEPSLSAGLAHTLITATPLHAWWESARLNPAFEPEAKSEFDIGSAAHTLMTGVGARIYRVEHDSWQKKDAKQQRDDARELGFTPLLADQHDRVLRMVESLRRQLRAHEIGDVFGRAQGDGRTEVSMFARLRGVWMRSRPDALEERERVIYDLKTSAELADPEPWSRRAAGMGISLRAALYCEIADALLPGGRPWRYRFVVVEKEPPHAMSVVGLSEMAMEMGRKRLSTAASLWRECLDADRWPAWTNAVAEIDEPAWETSRWLAREERDEAIRKSTPSRRLIDAALSFQHP